MRTAVSHPSRLGRLFIASLTLFSLLLARAPLRLGAADVFFDGTPGVSAPPATLGPYTMVPFGADGRAALSEVTSVPGPTGDVLLDRTAILRYVPSSWATWSHGYNGPVYQMAGHSEVTLNLPAHTAAFYLYAEPNEFGEVAFTVTAHGATSGPVSVHGSAGAKYFGFYSQGAALTSITVTAGASGFAIGEFGVSADPSLASSGLAPSSTPIENRADVGVVIYGGWTGMPVLSWVGGTAQPVLYTAPDASGQAATLHTFWPGAGESWPVTIEPALPEGLDAGRWELYPVGITTAGRWSAEVPASLQVTRGAQVLLHYQLIDNG